MSGVLDSIALALARASGVNCLISVILAAGKRENKSFRYMREMPATRGEEHPGDDCQEGGPRRSGQATQSQPPGSDLGAVGRNLEPPTSNGERRGNATHKRRQKAE
jgi:hypothetical protein